MWDLIIANHMAEHSDLDQIWMVVTPHNPLKKKNTLLDDYHRLQMVHLATEDFPKSSLRILSLNYP
jgi:nicotinate-nucleotide adenylyltransferase